jgi:hypothetical protein
MAVGLDWIHWTFLGGVSVLAGQATPSVEVGKDSFTYWINQPFSILVGGALLFFVVKLLDSTIKAKLEGDKETIKYLREDNLAVRTQQSVTFTEGMKRVEEAVRVATLAADTQAKSFVAVLAALHGSEKSLNEVLTILKFRPCLLSGQDQEGHQESVFTSVLKRRDEVLEKEEAKQ